MELLKERIRREGKVLPGNIIKVDGFLNHRVDTALMSQLADEFAKYFDVKDITMVLTAEASGIALARCAPRSTAFPWCSPRRPRVTTSKAACIRARSSPIPIRKK